MCPGLAVFLVTLPGTYARLLAVTWGKPVFGCFSSLGLDWLFFLAFWPVEFGILPAHRFCQFFFGHPSSFGLFVVLLPWVWSVLKRA